MSLSTCIYTDVPHIETRYIWGFNGLSSIWRDMASYYQAISVIEISAGIHQEATQLYLHYITAMSKTKAAYHWAAITDGSEQLTRVICIPHLSPDDEIIDQMISLTNCDIGEQDDYESPYTRPYFNPEETYILLTAHTALRRLDAPELYTLSDTKARHASAESLTSCGLMWDSTHVGVLTMYAVYRGDLWHC